MTLLRLRCNAFLAFVLSASIAVFAVGILGYTVLIPQFVGANVNQKMRLIPENEALERWANYSDPIYLSIHLFNITNIEEFRDGGPPRVQEIGPYVYLEKRTKRVDYMDENVISYSEYKSYRFLPEFSSGDPKEDIVHALNVPLVSVADFIEKTIPNFPWLEPVFQSVLHALTYKHDEDIVVRRTVDEMLFAGYDTPFVVEAVRLAKKALPSLEFDSHDRFGLLLNKNGSIADQYTVGTGAGDLPFTKIIEWNGKTELPYWGSDHCNQINGTDGSQFPPLTDKGNRLQIFSAELCRSIHLEHESDTEVKGIETQRYTVPAALYSSAEEVESNVCYCESPDKCDLSGIMNISKCRKGLPLMMSAPHFYMGEPKLSQDIIGLKPTKEKHETFLDISSMTGLVLRAAKRLQINIEVKPSLYVPTLENVTTRIIPVAWIEERMEATVSFTGLLKEKLVRPRNFAIAVCSLAVLIGGLSTVIVIVVSCIRDAKYFKSFDLKAISADDVRGAPEKTRENLEEATLSLKNGSETIVVTTRNGT
ncbi:lysosome membrane protein 2 [Galendromus occidentalis]|uniref:Scavenger receptor class B member 1 n=1 Tax=Galendromus occidentalis TaxID=34638 RepID=A0AAJ6QZ32_9ACAR|nr:lysosome membrane protein 2 [Galendromus occidentalis]